MRSLDLWTDFRAQVGFKSSGRFVKNDLIPTSRVKTRALQPICSRYTPALLLSGSDGEHVLDGAAVTATCGLCRRLPARTSRMDSSGMTVKGGYSRGRSVAPIL